MTSRLGKGMAQKHVSKKHEKRNGWKKRLEKNVREWDEQEKP